MMSNATPFNPKPEPQAELTLDQVMKNLEISTIRKQKEERMALQNKKQNI